jgi:uncharacterized caspase-like protein
MVRWTYVFLSLLALLGEAAAEERIALVIGIKEYSGRAPALIAPVNDAYLIAGVLRQAGFKLVHDAPLLNLTKMEFDDAIGRFAAMIKPDTVAAFYYAGHGGNIGQRNFLYPADIDYSAAVAEKNKFVDVGDIVTAMRARGGALSIVMLDACRTDGFRAYDPNMPTGFKAETGWFSRSSLFLSYSADIGALARDVSLTNPKHSPYALALAEALQVPGLKLRDVFSRVANNVIRATHNTQRPRSEAYLVGDDFYFTPPDAPSQVASPQQGQGQSMAPSKSLDAAIAEARKKGIETAALEQQERSRALEEQRRRDNQAKSDLAANTRSVAKMGYTLKDSFAVTGKSIGLVYATSVEQCALKCLEGNCDAFAWNKTGSGTQRACERYRQPITSVYGNTGYTAGVRPGISYPFYP